ncbi:hypothetical protein K438DRAFT_1845850 [Mycena galopus ATCC 62051]|nr:hypothetical protein K438DRAFT_1845850 [Mycena galopus ATCC 62051]
MTLHRSTISQVQSSGSIHFYPSRPDIESGIHLSASFVQFEGAACYEVRNLEFCGAKLFFSRHPETRVSSSTIEDGTLGESVNAREDGTDDSASDASDSDGLPSLQSVSASSSDSGEESDEDPGEAGGDANLNNSDSNLGLDATNNGSDDQVPETEAPLDTLNSGGMGPSDSEPFLPTGQAPTGGLEATSHRSQSENGVDNVDSGDELGDLNIDLDPSGTGIHTNLDAETNWFHNRIKAMFIQTELISAEIRLTLLHNTSCAFVIEVASPRSEQSATGQGGDV